MVLSLLLLDTWRLLLQQPPTSSMVDDIVRIILKFLSLVKDSAAKKFSSGYRKHLWIPSVGGISLIAVVHSRSGGSICSCCRTHATGTESWVLETFNSSSWLWNSKFLCWNSCLRWATLTTYLASPRDPPAVVSSDCAALQWENCSFQKDRIICRERTVW